LSTPEVSSEVYLSTPGTREYIRGDLLTLGAIGNATYEGALKMARKAVAHE
jgi:hypothetical protein